MFCKNCGKEIDDNAYVCPHCGVKVEKSELQSQEKNTLAIVGFVLSFFIAIAGLICSILAYRKCKNENAPQKGFAVAGIVISAISMALTVLIYIIAIAAVAATV